MLTWDVSQELGRQHKGETRLMYLSTNLSGVVHEIWENMSHRRECLQGCVSMVVSVLLFPMKGI